MCKAEDPCSALLVEMCGDEEEEGAGEERTGDCGVDARLSPSPCGVNKSISVLSVETEREVAGIDMSQLAVSTPESTDSDRRLVSMSEEGVKASLALFPSKSGHADSSVTQVSMRFPKLLYRFISKKGISSVPHTSPVGLQKENEQDTGVDNLRIHWLR